MPALTPIRKNTYKVDPKGDILLLPGARFRGHISATPFTSILVSSEQLQHKTSLFYEMVHDAFLTNTQPDLSLPSRVPLPADHDPEALAILMKILHGHDDIPLKMDLVLLYGIAYLVDLYGLHDLPKIREMRASLAATGDQRV